MSFSAIFLTVDVLKNWYYLRMPSQITQESDPGPRRALSAMHSEALVTKFLRELSTRDDGPASESFKPRLPTDKIRGVGQKVTDHLADDLGDGSAPPVSA